MFARPHHEQLRAEPRIFDIAFDVRDLEAECAFLHHLSLHLGRGRLDSFLESCCGPGFHMHWFAAQGVRAYGIDVDPDMLSYAQDKACRLAEEVRLSPEVNGRVRNGLAHPPNAMPIVADPLDYSLPEAADLAFCPRSSFRYLLEDEEVVTHLVTTAKNLGRGGLYVLELDHPAVVFGQRADPERTWEAKRDGVRVCVQRGSGREVVDPLTHICEVEWVFDVEEAGRDRTIRDRAPLRFFTHRELRALVGLSGVFEWVTTFGDLAVTQPFDASESSRRMVPVLRCSI